MLGTPDIVEDLALLGVLDDRVAVGSMNRGGLSGSVFEMDDRFTGYDVGGMVRDGLDAAKLLVRVNREDAATVRTLEKTADAVTAAARSGLPILLEPFLSSWREGRVVNDLTPDVVIASVAIAAGLGASSAYTWHLAQTARRSGDGARHGGDHAADAAARRRQRCLPRRDVRLLGGGARPPRGAWPRRRPHPPVPQDGDVAQAVDTAAALVHGR
ncbi:hypothetical protein O159_26860 [Leifsonia xyli subsp. cynodontis DSM 46306]|uniref:Cgl0159-like domain-containing protein n=1 Tax=Leifsonia xyli subsp. cynodontis DSM 46306 TaxID=1389489 RepID=U3P8I6_LEIXC|nr:hypothetical protein O159_26860 [Leifsonia xyli subsp. cynodontis DSM 46306]